MRGAKTLALFALAALGAASCAPTIPEGVLGCMDDDDCPGEWRCRGNGTCHPTALVCDELRAVREVIVTRERRQLLRELDVLLVVDDSGSMREEQASLAELLPDLARATTTGDYDGDGVAEAARFESVQFGLVTTDIGTLGNPLSTCDDPLRGQDAVLRVENPCGAFGPVLRLDAGRPLPLTELACMAQVGVEGCAFEQPLEAALKAVTPSVSTLRFFGDTLGHGDGANAGLVRPNSVVLVLIVTDEDDCSVLEPELTRLSSPVYAGTDLNLRCATYPDALHPVERYIDGLLALRRDPAELVFGLIAGVPSALLAPGVVPNPSALLTHPELADAVTPDGNNLLPSCVVPDRGVAYPPRLLLRVAEGIEARGGSIAVASICDLTFRPLLTQLRQGLTRAQSPCLRPFGTTERSARRCEVVTTVPPGESCGSVFASNEATLVGLDGGNEVCLLTPEVAWTQGSVGACQSAGLTDIALTLAQEYRGPLRLECQDIMSEAGTTCGPRVPCGQGLECDPASVTCQRACQIDSNCGGGHVCDAAMGVCTNPTCRPG